MSPKKIEERCPGFYGERVGRQEPKRQGSQWARETSLGDFGGKRCIFLDQNFLQVSKSLLILRFKGLKKKLKQRLVELVTDETAFKMVDLDFRKVRNHDVDSMDEATPEKKGK